ncbi:MAG: DUF4437 domain-containing protein [Pseudomonadota bacterium]
MPRPHIEPFVELNDGYKKFRLIGFTGADYKVLSLDTDTGACSLKVRFNNGFARKPGLSYSDMEMFVLGGEMQVGDDIIGEGHYMFVPAGVAIPAINVADGCEALVFYNDSEPDYEESDHHHDLALRAGYISLNSYQDTPWSGGSIVSPSVATGCMIKLLRFDPLTEAMTFLYCMTPEFMQDNISYHDCGEESYHIWGTSWMMQFGELPTGGYFWRPPYINHGSFRSKLGCIAIGRTDSKLHNYFHFNPWTNPNENLHRAASMLYRQRPQLFKWVAAEGGHNHPHGPSGQLAAAPHDFEHPEYLDDPQVDMLNKQVMRFLQADRSGHHHHHHDDD